MSRPDMKQVMAGVKIGAARTAAFCRETLWPTLVWMGKTGIPTSSGILAERLVQRLSSRIPPAVREKSVRAYAWAERSMSIERGAVASLVLHAAVIALAYFGLPWFTRSFDFVDIPISVEVVNVTDKTSAPPSRPTKPVKETEAPKPEPKQVAKAEPQQTPPPPPAKPKEEEVAIVPKPDTRPKAKVQPDKKPEPEKKPDLSKAKPKRKPKPQNDFAAVLKTLEDLKKAPPEKKEEKKPDEKNPFEKQIAEALEKPVARGTSTEPISISEIDLVRRQIAACWNLPAGAKEAENLIVEIKVAMNRDGTVADARITNTQRMGRDPFYRAAAESALRAVLNPKCSPLKLPPEKYDHWQTMTLNFDPRELLGP